MKKWLLPVLAVALLGGLWWVLATPERAPRVMFTTLDGRQIATEALHGKVALINFWATSCPGCVAEMPKLVETYRQYHAKGFEVVAVAMSYDPPSHVVNYAKKHALPFPVTLDADGRLAAAFGDVQLTPTSIVINRDGHVVQRVVGELDFAKLHAMLDRELGRPSS
ncbi:MAG: TlpA family protein disulfide reductase [Methylophilaceae bacterium]|nr:TlpA family protein disulfide reductase [Methylophilaceae bacterium]